MNPPLLDVRRLTVTFAGDCGASRAVRGISLQVSAGETLALVGESGCGKSTVARALLGLAPLTGAEVAGEVRFQGRNLLALDPVGWRRIRGREIALVFQDARAALNPVLTIGAHLSEILGARRVGSGREIRMRASQLLRECGLKKPEEVMRRYPSELSGGMCQRVGIALAVSRRPCLLIADEPMSSLDPPMQQQLLALLREVQRRHDLALILISHDLPLVADFAHRVAVMYHGRIVEQGSTSRVLGEPRHPYTRGLLEAAPSLAQTRAQRPLCPIPGMPPILTEDLPGCPFAPRCALVEPRCLEQDPPPLEIAEGHWAACIKAG